MANTKKNIEEDVELMAEEAPVKKEAKAKKEIKKFLPNDAIECRSVTAGELILVGAKTKLQYTWANYGDTAYVEYQDLQALQSLKSSFLVRPLFIIEDEDLVAQWSNMLKPIYEKINNQDIDDIFTLSPNRFRVKISNLPKGLQNTIKTTAAQRIQSGELYDIRIVKIIDEVLGTDLVELFIK